MTALVAGCGGHSQTAQARAKATPQAHFTPLKESAHPTVAVFDRVGRTGHVVTLVRVDGRSAKVLARATFQRRSPSQAANPCPLSIGCAGALEPQYVSTSNDKVYVLDGDSTIYELRQDGSRQRVTSIPGTDTVIAAFAVSPDDSRIAVAAMGVGSQTLYVEKLGGGGRVTLAAPGPQTYWPVGWHDREIVLAAGNRFGASSVPLNPYGAQAYGLLDLSVGGHFSPIQSGDCAPTGFLTSAGTACVTDFGQPCLGGVAGHSGGHYSYYSCLRRLDWTGHETILLLPNIAVTKGVVGTVSALSPDGKAIMTDWMFLATASEEHAWPYANPSDDQPDIAWIDAAHVSWNYRYSDGSVAQRIVELGEGYASIANVVYDGSPVVGGAPRSPVTGALVATMPAAL